MAKLSSCFSGGRYWRVPENEGMERAMTDLSDTFINALPDLTLVVRRDGLIMSNLGGRELGVAKPPGALSGTLLRELWTDEVAVELAKLIRRALKARAQTDGRFYHDSRRIDVRVHPQGVDRVLMVLRALPVDTHVCADLGMADTTRMRDTTDCAAFASRLCDAIANARLRETQLALAIVHFNNLPAIGSVFGASAGRMLLTAALERIDTLAASGTLNLPRKLRATQLETDQVAVLMEEISSRETAARAAGEIRRAVAKAIELDGHRYDLDPAIGLAIFPSDGHEPEVLLDRARGAILEAHRLGRQSQVAACSDTAATQALPTPDLERELRWAVEREQFALEYAPIIELVGRRTVAIATSLKWIHPMCGPVASHQFLPLLETLNVRASLDRWILRRGCRDLADLSERGNTRVSLSLKLTRQSTDSATFIEDINSAAATVGIGLARLEIDVDLKTLAGGSRVRGQLRELRKSGARVFLEDFGAGGIALARLSSLPLDGVKICPTFVSRLDNDDAARAVCKAAVSIARAFDLKCIAAGVAARSQLELLHEWGCEQATGPLFGLPRPARELGLAPFADTSDPQFEAAALAAG
jgi:predicted signal transduction protein with EAL and GGDEF domain